MAVSPQDRFLADLQKATAGITYTPGQISGLTSLTAGASPGSLQTIANAPVRQPTTRVPSPPPPGPGPGETVIRQAIPYPTTLPALSAGMFEALEARRAASLRQLQEAEARADSLRQSAELENVGRLLNIEEDTGLERRSGLGDLASRGLARSPLFANPFRRELARQQQRQIGESQRQLTSTLDQLQQALLAARQRRESELAQLSFDETKARSDVDRLLGFA